MILRQTVHLSAEAPALYLPQDKFVSMCDHMLRAAELRADELGYALEDSSNYIHCCELLTAADFGKELSCSERLNIWGFVVELYFGEDEERE